MRQLPISIYKQQYSNTCVHTVIRVVAEFLGHKLSSNQIFDILGHDKDGLYLTTAARKINKHFKTKSKTLKSIREIKKYIMDGNLVMAGDNYTYSEGHAVLIVGVDPKNFSVFDPNTGIIKLINKRKVFKGSDENVVIYKD